MHGRAQAPAYWRAPFRALATGKQLAEYVVLDVEDLGQTVGRYSLARAEVRILLVTFQCFPRLRQSGNMVRVSPMGVSAGFGIRHAVMLHPDSMQRVAFDGPGTCA